MKRREAKKITKQFRAMDEGGHGPVPSDEEIIAILAADSPANRDALNAFARRRRDWYSLRCSERVRSRPLGALPWSAYVDLTTSRRVAVAAERARQRTLRTPEKALDAFIAGLEKGWSIDKAARKAGIGRRTVFEIRQKDEAFALRWADAIEVGSDALEDVIDEAAKQEHNITAAIFLLKARRPEKYRETYRVDQTTTIRDERHAAKIRAAAEADPDAFERLSRALAEDAA